MEDYDEDLTCNPFLKFFQQNYRFLYEEAIRKHWILCIPSVVSLCDRQFDEKYIKQHVILQDGDVSKTLSNEPVSIENNILKFGTSSVKILFRETFYTELGKVSAFCINRQENVSIELPTTSQRRSIWKTVKRVKHDISVYCKSDSSLGDQSKLEDFVGTIQTKIANLDSKVSSCVVYNLYDQLIDLITVLFRNEDQKLNKIRKNRFLDDDKELNEFSLCLRKAAAEFDEISRKKLVGRKLNALKVTVQCLTETDTPTELGADKLLSLFSHLVIHSSVTNWYAQLYVMKHFYTPVKYGEESYYLSTLEATLDHLKSYSSLCIIEPTTKVTNHFYSASIGDAAALDEIFSSCKFKCHPLCDCQLCGIPLVVNPTHPDSNGWTVLHYTIINGHTEATQVLLKSAFSDNVEQRDLNGMTALHWAAYRGFQMGLLLLCHQKCDLNVMDDNGSMPIHLAVLNGHESCVKALLYYAEQARFKLEIDAQNNEGDTPLHLAARWGYENVVNLLLQWNVDRNIVNNRNLTAVCVAQNRKLSQFISQYNETT